MSEPTTRVLWLLRHGEREDFADLSWAETAERPHDPGLSAQGLEEARRAGARLCGEPISRIITSPYLRCAQTAGIVATQLDVPIHVEPGLGELNHPDWTSGAPSLLSLEEIAAIIHAIETSHEPIIVPSYPETLDEAFARAGVTAKTIVSRYDGQLLLVAHAVSIFGIVRALTGQEATLCRTASLFRLVRQSGDWIATMLGDTSHLEDGMHPA